MSALTMSLAAEDLANRIQDRLRVLSAGAAKTVLWQQKSNRVLVYVDSLQSRIVGGWLLCNLDLQSDETGRQTLQFVFFVGSQGTGDGLHAGATINAASAQGSLLAEAWGTALQRVIWDAVLDAIEAALAQAGTQNPGSVLTLQGFHAAANTFAADIIVGAN
jgi:hypothetical protein